MELNEDYSRSFQDLLFHLLWSFFLPIRSNRIIQLKNTSQHDSLFVFTNPKKNDKNVKIQRKAKKKRGTFISFRPTIRVSSLSFSRNNIDNNISLRQWNTNSNEDCNQRGTAWKRIYPRTKKHCIVAPFPFPQDYSRLEFSFSLFHFFFSSISLLSSRGGRR